MDEPQPEVRWAPLPPAPKRTGRVWLIVGLSVAALAIVGVLLFFLLPRDGGPEPAGSASPSPTASPSETSAPTPTATSAPSATPDPTPITTAPPVGDPTVEVFRDKVSGWLNSADRGLDIIAGASGQDALPVVDSLQQDAQRLGDALPPSSIQDPWRSGVETYAQRLAALRAAIESGSGVSGAIADARSAAADLRGLVGL
ncbi:hypothetical protein AB1285_09300 [Microbacterium sp. NRRL B-14842]|uniref:hypothetical protein n=1 Tax=Microbacterium TaxID=33882 RepID=UPI0021A5CD90|nr:MULTISPECIES: hypothetical protein [Microbacterium]MCT1364500.1 hypothetical protein [Microbacterium sp. p3-SID131]MCT1376405.1 hypothetical protein [Microbacterium sp. p3-SID337]MCZ0709090.1 hypothetical protein [Microbacterium paraoxydans]